MEPTYLVTVVTRLDTYVYSLSTSVNLVGVLKHTAVTGDHHYRIQLAYQDLFLV